MRLELVMNYDAQNQLTKARAWANACRAQADALRTKLNTAARVAGAHVGDLPRQLASAVAELTRAREDYRGWQRVVERLR